ncbi:hypothetical protein NQZ68_010885 [Dissostichus eleginoides]|nr:hypothetical protein NQZ68_010885 [Dissostichus eleginoides]
MTQPAPQLPAEVWSHVFGYLSAADKFSVRTACKYFKKLVDHGSLWKDWSVVLGYHKGYYNSPFWGTLRRRKVTSVVLRGTRTKDLKPLASSLPTLTTVVMDQSSQASLSFLKECTHLKRLAIRGLSPQDMEAVSVQVPNLLHLHIDPWPSHLGAQAAQIPQLFPKLKSLKLRHEHVSERDFLQLHQLKDLEYLEILDIRPHLSELTRKLQALTNFRLQVTTSPRRRDVLTCPCVCQVN